MRYFLKENLTDILKSTPCAVYAPVEDGVGVEYARYEDGMALNLDKIPTDKTPKDILFPQWENLMHFRMDGKSIELTEQARSSEEYVIFGIRACDIRAFEVLDRVFLAEPVDSYYAARRAHGTLVGIACAEPADSCFCGAFGIDPAEPAADVILWPVADEFYVEARTEKGKRLVENWELIEGDDMPVDWIKGEIAKKLAATPLADLDVSGFTPDRLNELFESPKWKRLSMPCIGCGSCTFSCPTCQCYDIRDYDTGNGIERYRCWDSCMYSDFTMMSHGTPRPTQVERFRQRFMHKLMYTMANTGVHSCVGCGRCIHKCPMNLSIVKVIQTLGREA
ncbi:MAG: 4Fe-4S dicluster domain-containing protein [Christensenellales bacterium]|jgi:sulfhydrogenase subunit beta (sulfur reductase)